MWWRKPVEDPVYNKHNFRCQRCGVTAFNMVKAGDPPFRPENWYISKDLIQCARCVRKDIEGSMVSHYDRTGDDDMGHYDSSRPGYCAGCGAAPGNMRADGTCPFCDIPANKATVKEVRAARDAAESKIAERLEQELTPDTTVHGLRRRISEIENELAKLLAPLAKLGATSLNIDVRLGYTVGENSATIASVKINMEL